jgi:hypothetical protein
MSLPPFAVGQRWSVKTAAPSTLRVVIGRVEALAGDNWIVHVSLCDVPIPAGMPGEGDVLDIGHMPIDVRALAASVESLVATGVTPARYFEDGYDEWRAAGGGAFTCSVPEAIKFAFDSLKGGGWTGRRDEIKE